MLDIWESIEVTTADETGTLVVYDTSGVIREKQKARERLSGLKRNDNRVRTRLAQKCGKKSTDRTKNIINVVTKAIIDTGKTPVLEDLEGITKLYNKKNKRGRNANFKGKSWSCSEYANQINYKTNQQGDVVIFIDPSSTSSRCWY